MKIRGKNVNEVYPLGLMMLDQQGVSQPSQHGGTLEMPTPVIVQYDNPRERVLFDKERASNPFLNLFEALWIIAGRNDVEFLKHLVPNMQRYSDDGVTYYGAYGHRMRYGGDGDQIEHAVRRLKTNPDDRQVVLTIRTPEDMFYTGKDQPCNMMVACKIRNGKLNINVFNRSNDFIWGLTGTNVVQFSMLQEYLAGRIGVEVGTYYQTTDSMHVYTNEQWAKLRDAYTKPVVDPYVLGHTAPFDMMQCSELWDDDLCDFFYRYMAGIRGVRDSYRTPFFKEVVVPMWYTFQQYAKYRETKDAAHLDDAILYTDSIAECDWKLIAKQWLQNIKDKK